MNVKNNIVPVGYAQHGRFMPHKDIVRVNYPKAEFTMSGNTTTNFIYRQGMFLPDDVRTEDFSGSVIYRVGLGVYFMNGSETAFPAAISIAGIYLLGWELEGTELTEDPVTGISYAMVDDCYSMYVNASDIAGVTGGDIVNSGMAYFEVNRIAQPSKFLIDKINPMAYTLFDVVFTIKTSDEESGVNDKYFGVTGFVDFANMKD